MSNKLDIKVFEPPINRRYWVVKADAGKHYETFISNSLIAIGHFNHFAIGIDNSNPFVATSNEIKKRMTTRKEGENHVNPNNFGQVNSFVNEIKIGDWVITKTLKHIRVGQVTSAARVDNKVVKHTINKGQTYEREVKLDFILKRSVCWGPEIKMRHISAGMLNSLRSPMTLYNIDQHMGSICYTLYPFFKINNSLHLSIKINSEEEISNYYLTKVFSYLNELEFISQVDLGNEDLSEIYQSFIDEGIFNLTTQASFHSPGDIWVKILFPSGQPKTNMAKALLIYSMMFGNHQLGIDGVLDLQSRQKVWDTVIERVDMKVMKSTVEKLNLTMPKYETENIEVISDDDIHIV